MLRPIIRLVEFDYADGYLFWDKAGRVACDLVQAVPNLRLRNQTLDQRDFFVPDSTVELYYGVRVAWLRSFEEDAAEFRNCARSLFDILTQELELKLLTRFKFHLGLGWPCSSPEEAHNLAMDLLPPQVSYQAPFGEFQAAQLEVRKGAVVITTRLTLLNISPPPGPIRFAPPEKLVPHMAQMVSWEGFDRLPASDFRLNEILEQVERQTHDELLNRINTRQPRDAKPS